MFVPVLGLACRAAPIPPDQRYPAGTGLEAHTVVVDGTRLRYVELGTGPVVLLIHGLGGSIYSWRGIIGPVAAAGYRVIAFDNRGFGESEKPARGYRNADYVHLIAALMDTLRVPQAVLVGHSMGGAIAADVALAAPARVRGLVLIDAAGYGTRWPWSLRLARWPVVGSLLIGLRGRATVAELLRSMYADPTKVSTGDVDQYYAPVAEPDFGPALRGVLQEFRFDDLFGKLDGLQAPALLIWGAQDRLIPQALGRQMAHDIPRVAFVLVPRAGHAAAEEAPEAVARSLTAFLKQGVPTIPADLAIR